MYKNLPGKKTLGDQLHSLLCWRFPQSLCKCKRKDHHSYRYPEMLIKKKNSLGSKYSGGLKTQHVQYLDGQILSNFNRHWVFAWLGQNGWHFECFFRISNGLVFLIVVTIAIAMPDHSIIQPFKI